MALNKISSTRFLFRENSLNLQLKNEKPMNVEEIERLIKKKPTVCSTLGMRFLSTPEPDTVMATMPVDERTRQPFGYLSGGAMLALEECLAGVGSLALCPDVVNMGINVGANHVKAAAEGSEVTATARLVSQTHHLHVWDVTIANANGETVSTARVTNYITSRPLS